MVRKLPFFPTCGSPSRTLSFRAAISDDLHDMAAISGEEEDQLSSIESVIRGLSSDRFFFKPEKTSSILEEAKPKEKEKEEEKGDGVLPLKESSVSMMEIESSDPFIDFKKSMQEMVEADEGLKEWENLQELLSWYLAVNEKINHGYIIGAFVDLVLVNLGSSSSSSSSCCSSSSMNGQDQSSLIMGSGSNNKNMISSESPESALSFTSSSASSSGTCSSTSHCLSSCSLEEEDDDDDDHGDDEDHSSAQKAVVLSDDASSSKAD
ncbi:transcription repressor OFP15-like [Cynara cardunculus var. scolymus]|uniref:Transcription repressor n=1 Tax=Cynara cardunculus var. scolymus TaxID=59895 RepID=A0A103YFW5_CYNCS|nr:transcription repressor OFP15-like [Cynara cardunculus var. scolymus]KVI08339.1 Ovate protein family, C-terminal [Cynara cardunculus var. scolymus]